jgi:general secretion pathway protein G
MDKEMKQSVIRKSFSQKEKKVSGFTLIELLIVMIIIGLLAAFVVPKLIGKVDDSKIIAAKAQIELISTALDMYKLDTGKYPSQGTGLSALNTKAEDVDNWNGPYLKKEKVPKDPWGAEYVYKYPGEHGDFDIVSYGADKAQGGDGNNKDIVSWE